MNQDQVKEKLLQLDSEVEDFVVVFSGKSSKKVDGLYKPENKEILIHNKNFPDSSDNGILYTAIHEFAHHIQFTKSPKPVTSRSHTSDFYNLLHILLYKAEELGIYTNEFEKDEDFKKLTDKIKSEYLAKNGELMKDFGSLLFQAYELCQIKRASFEDYVDRILGLHRSTAKTLINMNDLNVDHRVGYENMKTLTRIKDDVIREQAEDAFLKGYSPDMVKAEFVAKDLPDSRLEFLLQERERVEKGIEKMIEKLGKLDMQIEEVKQNIDETNESE